MVELEQRLVDLGSVLVFPRADSLADDVLAQIASPARPWRRPLLAAAAVLLVVATVVAAVPDARHAVARWLGFESLRIEVVDRIPDEVRSAATDAPPPAARPRMTLDEAAAVAGVTPRVAEGLGPVVSVSTPGGRAVAVAYEVDGVDVVVTTLPGRLDEGSFHKLVSAGATVTPVDVGGRAGYWIAGRPHVFMYLDQDGEIREARPAADTVAWQDGDVIIRVEADVPLERALAFAAAVGTP